jgi:hypothetical protein
MHKNSGLDIETISMVLLCLQAMRTDWGSCCQHELHSQMILLSKRLWPFVFLQVLLTIMTGMVSEGSIVLIASMGPKMQRPVRMQT